MATKVTDFLARARITQGTVLLAGGTTQNRHFIRRLSERNPGIRFVIPPEAPYFEAAGAAILARTAGTPLPPREKLIGSNEVKFERYEDLKKSRGLVRYHESRTGYVRRGREYVLGVDGGSTTTKACLIDAETKEIAASHYGRTHGDPVGALKNCLKAIREKIMADTGAGSVPESGIRISLTATTGSSREILGVFLQTPGVYNEIIAHSVGTTFYSDDVDTIFEIGGQDAKYVLLKNKVPIDYAMNEACSAGTGSFLEESAQGDLNIESASEIGDIALQAERPLKFGEHCSAFINSDIRKAVQQGATREDITAGIVTSIVSNYLNRVVGNRTIGKRIFLQGGVAKNKAVPLAFAMLLGKEILVPPSPELMGCFGVGLLAMQKERDGLLGKGSYDIDALIDTTIVYEREFVCKTCENRCPIQVLAVNGEKYLFGGRCSKYTNSRRKTGTRSDAVDWVARRMDLMFVEFAPPGSFQARRKYTIGIPRCFSVYTLYPLYAWFFHSLGIETILSDEIPHEGVARTESTYCFPAEIDHGAVQDLVNRGTDYILLPHFRDMNSYEKDVHANFCPITQGLPYYIVKAFPEVPAGRFLPLVVSFKFGTEKALEFFTDLGTRLGIGAAEIRDAFRIALSKQEEYEKAAAKLGEDALAAARIDSRPVIALLGRPYNAFTKDANMGVPRKFTSRGFTVIPFDILPFGDRTIFRNMYWYYGQQDMKAGALFKEEPNIYGAFISNFSCAPDSFMLHYLRWYMGTKPFLILELDSHSADAGIDTRVEAFLDIIDGYRLKAAELSDSHYANGLEFVNNGKEPIHILDTNRNEKIPIIGNGRVKLLLSNMGDLSTRLSAAALRATGIAAVPLPVADRRTIQIARSHASGKECVPSHIVLGSALKFLSSEEYRKDEIYLLFVPETTGPCRTGQYAVFFRNLFQDLRLENVVVFTLSSDNSYNELGPDFSKNMWWGIAAADYLKDIHTSLRACAMDRESALRRFDELWENLLVEVERDLKNLVPALRTMAKQLRGIPLARPVRETPRVLIVGEIYVRRDDYAVDELVDLFSAKRIIGKVSGIAEWIHYTAFVRDYDIRKRLRLVPWHRKAFSRELRSFIRYRIEDAWKEAVERKVRRILEKSGLVPPCPHDMRTIMGNTTKHFLNLELNSEIAVSTGVASTAMEQGYSGVVNICPFACLIGRVIEGLYTPWARNGVSRSSRSRWTATSFHPTS
jgi:predicted CoA-substrate-specific enzyme activase